MVAQERPVLSAYTLEAGTAHVADTYLSPLSYGGWTVALSYERMQAMRFNPERWVMQLRGRASFDDMLSPVKNATMLGIDFGIGWGMMHRWQLDSHWRLMAGGSTDAYVGVLYSARNSNNPASAKASWTVNATAAAVFNTHIKSLPICVRYQAEMPVVGAFFSPVYDELYYEIWLGNHSRLVHTAWPGSYFRLGNLLTADLRFGATILRLGYRCNILSSKTENIVTRSVTHTAVVGVASEWLAIGTKGGRNLEKAHIISALY